MDSKIGLAIARLERIKLFLEGWQHTGSISNIERNVVLSQLASLYDELSCADTATVQRQEVKKAEQPAVAVPVEVEQLVVEEEIVEQPPKLTVEKVAEQPVAREPIVEEEEIEPVPVKVKPAVKPDRAKEAAAQTEQPVAVRLGESFNDTRKFLYENLGNSNEIGGASQPRINDINRAIGINDRFLFIKELFNGNQELFNKTIARLNDSESLDDALVYIHHNFSWDDSSPAVKQLLLLLYRRFV